jgi:isopropylmalate/homocitrate/citramalate synthase
LWIIDKKCEVKEIVKMEDKERWLDYRNRISMGLGLDGEQARWIFEKALEAIEQAEKVEIYEKALTKIATKKMSMYISSSHMNQDFIKVANDALEEGLTGD